MKMFASIIWDNVKGSQHKNTLLWCPKKGFTSNGCELISNVDLVKTLSHLLF